MSVKPEAATPEPTELQPGFNVLVDGLLLGNYPTSHDAENFAFGHLKGNGSTYEIVEV